MNSVTLKIWDEAAQQYVSVPAIKGDKGDAGEKGDKGDPLTYGDMSTEEKSDLLKDCVGKKTTGGGEIFNDYENNVADTPKSHVEGANNKSPQGNIWPVHISGKGNTVENIGWRTAFCTGGANYVVTNKDDLPEYEELPTGDYQFIDVGGAKNRVAANKGFVRGEANLVTGGYPFALGTYNEIAGNHNVGFGYGNKLTGTYGIANGMFLQLSGNNQIAMGSYNVDDQAAVFMIGTGTNQKRVNGFAVKKDGSAEIEIQGTTEKSVVQKKYIDDKLKNLTISSEQLTEKSVTKEKLGDNLLSFLAATYLKQGSLVNYKLTDRVDLKRGKMYFFDRHGTYGDKVQLYTTSTEDGSVIPVEAYQGTIQSAMSGIVIYPNGNSSKYIGIIDTPTLLNFASAIQSVQFESNSTMPDIWLAGTTDGQLFHCWEIG